MNGIRVESLKDLPAQKTLVAYIREAIALNDKPAAAKRKVKVPAVPKDFKAALELNREAHANFDAFAPSYRRDHLEWILEARQPATRERRIAQSVEWLAEGKPRNWKYMKK